ncbi:PspC domain-containing protein [Caviibacter abscessus]|uniref:PspC domain-containing protein n=1 Tax=Caviibacter abscessus TaxID=1766719 RepID=UPI00082FEB12|nr:PspC domain-containing protein [Caviibacter abscessus]
MTNKNLYRSSTNKKIFGIAGGIGEYFNIDPTIVRVLWLLSIFLGLPIIIYFILYFIIPEQTNYWD